MINWVKKSTIEAFSGGFYGNSKAYDMSEEEAPSLSGVEGQVYRCLEDALSASPVPKPKPKPKPQRKDDACSV